MTWGEIAGLVLMAAGLGLGLVVMERMMGLWDDLAARLDVQAADLSALSVAVTGKNAELAKLKAENVDLKAQVVALSGDTVVQGLLDRVVASNAIIEAQTAALAPIAPTA